MNRMSKCAEKHQQLEYVDEFQNITNYNQISPYKVVATVTQDRRHKLFKNLQRSNKTRKLWKYYLAFYSLDLAIILAKHHGHSS